MHKSLPLGMVLTCLFYFRNKSNWKECSF